MREKLVKNAQFILINEHFEAVFLVLMPHKFGLQQSQPGRLMARKKTPRLGASTVNKGWQFPVQLRGQSHDLPSL